MTDKVSATQADREAAADIWRDLIAKPGECIAEKTMRAGGVMDATPLVQAFARHRTGTDGEGTHWLDNLLTYHESGGHEGDGSDHALRQARKALSTLRTTHSPSEAEAAVNAIAKIEMDREGYPLSRSQEEIYADAWETFEAARSALSLPSDKTVELLREELEAALDEREQERGRLPDGSPHWSVRARELLAKLDAHLGEQS